MSRSHLSRESLPHQLCPAPHIRDLVSFSEDTYSVSCSLTLAFENRERSIWRRNSSTSPSFLSLDSDTSLWVKTQSKAHFLCFWWRNVQPLWMRVGSHAATPVSLLNFLVGGGFDQVELGDGSPRPPVSSPLPECPALQSREEHWSFAFIFSLLLLLWPIWGRKIRKQDFPLHLPNPTVWVYQPLV